MQKSMKMDTTDRNKNKALQCFRTAIAESKPCVALPLDESSPLRRNEKGTFIIMPRAMGYTHTMMMIQQIQNILERGE